MYLLSGAFLLEEVVGRVRDEKADSTRLIDQWRKKNKEMLRQAGEQFIIVYQPDGDDGGYPADATFDLLNMREMTKRGCFTPGTILRSERGYFIVSGKEWQLLEPLWSADDLSATKYYTVHHRKIS